MNQKRIGGRQKTMYSDKLIRMFSERTEHTHTTREKMESDMLRCLSKFCVCMCVCVCACVCGLAATFT